jgi:hypothetical protein
MRAHSKEMVARENVWLARVLFEIYRSPNLVSKDLQLGVSQTLTGWAQVGNVSVPSLPLRKEKIGPQLNTLNTYTIIVPKNL